MANITFTDLGVTDKGDWGAIAKALCVSQPGSLGHGP